MIKKSFLIFLLLFIFITNVNAQKYLENILGTKYSPDELITLSPSLPFNQAIDLLNKVSIRASGKKILLTSNFTNPINVEIINMYYLRALDIIVKYAGLIYEQKDDLILVKKILDDPKKSDPAKYASVDTREVNIVAVFYENDVAKSKETGLDWKFLLSKDGLEIGGDFGKPLSTDNTTTDNTNKYQVSTKSTFDIGGFFGEATSVFKYLENENVGEIISSPNITVRDRVKGRIQVGTDFSIKQKDFSGNVVERFFPTGTIIEVTPYVYREDSLSYILLDINVERSTFQQTELTSQINKTQAKTQVILLDGEETVIGGLFTNKETNDRVGVPLLKDLPWWFFGLRYVFGSEKTSINKQELVILIKASLVPTLKERISAIKTKGSPIEKEVKKNRNRIKYYNFKSNENK